MNWLSIAISVLQLIPAIIKAMKALEEAIPENNVGPLKLAVIRETLLAINDQVAEIWPYIEKAINAIVAVFNQVGIFTTNKKEIKK